MHAPEVDIVLNGEVRRVAAGTTVAMLVEALGRDPRTVAVERNGDILPRRAWSGSALVEGDRLELVHFVQGGWSG